MSDSDVYGVAIITKEVLDSKGEAGKAALVAQAICYTFNKMVDTGLASPGHLACEGPKVHDKHEAWKFDLVWRSDK